MKLGINLGYWGKGNDASNVDLAVEADQLGYNVAWVAEAYGSDAVSVLAYVAAKTNRIDVGSAVMQIPARTPAMTAMTAATIDSLSGGRFRLGLGLSGPQVSEGWHGVRYAHPLGRTREYVDIVKRAWTRERLMYDGKHFQLPLPDGEGKALKLTVHPVRAQIPIYLASVGPKNLELTGEVADGWLGVSAAYDDMGDSLDHIKAGREKAGKSLDGFDYAISCSTAIGADIESLADRIRPHHALYIGGMGSRKTNFYNRNAVRLGYQDDAERIQDLYLGRKYDEAAAAVPTELVDRTGLIGPVDRVAERLSILAEQGITTVNCSVYGDGSNGSEIEQVRLLAEAGRKAGIL
ncbi:F420-dependent oxidoreductase-like protein [Antricoccus suffuscus]|uniref:F420-dependent oxidoreductase-like protein n=1 Tax=Antricoccus suffuscus TaxID=1629062 RepID=A0A2T1A0V8_9ACTN|nr:LLM class F420-dependent oxidoreductase [Antricoccus suffuscus]PRZ42164.1 F420-dependent oxidoreductase-like protein [Antricoccus suffuscus]